MLHKINVIMRKPENGLTNTQIKNRSLCRVRLNTMD